MMLSPKVIEAFLAVVEHGSLGRAAEVLHLTQPALSRIIKRLECQIEVPVFERQAKGMTLTVYGQALLPYAQLLHAEGRHALDEIDAIRGMRRGLVRIGTVASAAMLILPGVIRAVAARRPDFTYEVIEGVEDKLVEALLANEIDVAIASSIRPDDTIVQLTNRRFTDTYCVIAAPAHPIFAIDAPSYADLARMQWVMPGSLAEPRRQFEELVAAIGERPPRIMVETRSIATQKALVAHGDFLGWLPRPLVEAEFTAGTLKPVPFEPLHMVREFHVYRAVRRLTPPAVVEFIQELCSCQQKRAELRIAS